MKTSTTRPALIAITAVSSLLALFLILGRPVGAENPISVDFNGNPAKWGTFPITYTVDAGTLGGLSNALANTLVANAFGAWNGVASATVSAVQNGTPGLPGPGGDVATIADYNTLNTTTNCINLNPIIYDTNGTIIDALFGAGASNSILGFAGPCAINNNNIILGGHGTINGKPLAGVPTALDQSRTQAVMTHELGHYLGLGHSQVNLNCLTNLASCPNGSADLLGVPTMFPILLNQVEAVNKSFGTTLAADDIASISNLYPKTTPDLGFGTISGTVFFSDGVSPVQGANVIARRVGDPRVTAVSNVSGVLANANSGNPALGLPPSLSGSSDATIRGDFTIPYLPPGTYTLEVESANPSFTGSSNLGALSAGTGRNENIPIPTPNEFECYAGASESNSDSAAPCANIIVTGGNTVTGKNFILNEILATQDAFDVAAANESILMPSYISNGTFHASISSLAASDTDVYAISVLANQTLTVETMSRRLSPARFLDTVLDITDADGVQPQTCNIGDASGTFTSACLDDDFTPTGGGFTRDSKLQFKPAVSGLVFVRVTDHYGDARPDFLYDLIVTGAQPVPTVIFIPPVLAFGQQNVGAPVAQNIQVKNESASPQTLTSPLAVTTGNSSDFVIVAPTSGSPACSLVSTTPLAAGGSCFAGVKFTPGGAGQRASLVQGAHNAADSPAVLHVSGTGSSGPPNDNFANAMDTNTNPFSDTEDTTLATQQTGTDIPLSTAPCNIGSPPVNDRSVWYKYHVPIGGNAQVQFFAPYDAALAIGIGPLPLSSTACFPIPANTPATLNIDATGAVAADLYFMVAATGPNGGSETFTLTFTPTGIDADLSITKTTGGAIFTEGSLGTYTITVTNSGTTATTVAIPIVVRDFLPLGLTFNNSTGSSAGWSCSGVGQLVTCTDSSILASGANTKIILNVNVAPPAAASSPVLNFAQVFGGGDHTPANNITIPFVSTIVNPEPAPGVSLSPVPSDFGQITVGTTSAVQTVVLTNTGNAPLNVTSIALGGTDAAQFNLITSPNGGFTCPAGANTIPPSVGGGNSSCTFGVSMSPTSTGAKSARATVTSNATKTSPDSLPLTGTGVASGSLGTLSFDITTLNFPDTVVGTASAPKQAVLTNAGPGSVTITDIQDTPSGQNDFVGALPLAGDCDVVVVLSGSGPGSSCNLRGRFTPTQTGARTATVTIIATGASNSPALTVNGNGLAAPGTAALSLSVNPLNFPNQAVGTTSSVLTSVLSNAGPGSAFITNIKSAGSTDFISPTPAQAADCQDGIVLGSGSSCNFRTMFNPSTTGPLLATWTVEANNAPASPLVLTANGTGTIAATIAAKSGTPQTVAINTAFATLVATVKNAGGSGVSGVQVTFAAPTSGASGNFPGPVTSVQVTTDGSGLATAPTFTANGTAGGPYNVTATAAGVATPANFSLTNATAATLNNFTNGAGGNLWTTAGNWSLGLPVAGQTVTDTGGLDITLSSGVPQTVGTMSFSNGGTLTISGTGSLTITNPSSATNLTISGGTLTANASLTASGTFALNSGTLNGTGNVTVSSPLNWSGGRMTGLGTTTSNGTMNLSGGFLDGRTLNNAGTANVTGALDAGNSAIINNQTTGNFNLQGDVFIGNVTVGGTSTFNNAGTLTKTAGTGAGGGGFNNTVTFNNNGGTVNDSSGFLHFDNGLTQTGAGGRTAAQGTTTIVGNLTLNGGILAGGGTVTGNVIVNTGNVNPAGGQAAGTLTISGNYTHGAGAILNIQLANAGCTANDQLAVTGSATINGGTLNVTSLNGCAPAAGQNFTAMTFASHGGVPGDFATTSFNGLGLTDVFNSGNLTLSATGLQLTLSLNPGDFGSQAVNTMSAVKQSVLTNNGPGAATITNIQFGGTNPGDFAQALPVVAGDCANLAPVVNNFAANTSCNLRGTFTPTATGPRTATLTITASAPSNSPVLNLQGTGTAPDLTITKTHTGNFTRGQVGATYTITVTNSGTASTSGTVTVIDTLPAGLTATAFSGTGWASSTTLPTTSPVTFTRSDVLAASSPYPAITLTVTVANNAAASVANTATVSGGGETNTANDTANDPTTVNPPAGIDLWISKSHTGNFIQGVNGVYTITVTNIGDSTTTGAAIVTDTLPAGLGFVTSAGTGWVCIPNLQVVTCTHNTAIAAGANSAFTLTVSVNATALANSPVTNQVTVSDIGDGNPGGADKSSTDPTTISTIDLQITKSHTGNFVVGVNGTYTIAVNNAGNVPSTGQISVSDTLPTGLTFVSGTGAGWTCGAAGQVVTCTNAGPINAGITSNISLVVGVGAAAAPSVTNTATVSGGGETDTSNDTANDPTNVIPTGCTILYTGANGGAWATGTNWATSASSNIVPGSSDTVCITGANAPTISAATGAKTITKLTHSGTGTLTISGGSLTFTLASTATNITISGGTLTANAALAISGALTFSSGTLNGTGNVTIASPLTWSGGTMSGTGTFTNNGTGAGAATISGGVLDGKTFLNAGTLNFPNFSNLQAANSAVVTNLPAGVINTQGNGNITHTGGGAIINFNNQGSFNRNGAAGTFEFAGVSFNNTGTGITTVDATGEIKTNNSDYIQSGGITVLTGGKLSTQIGTTTLTGGVLRGTGTVGGDLASAVNNSGGTIQPGLSPGILTISTVGAAGYTQSATGVLDIEISGTTVGTQYDQLNLTVNAALGGTLKVTLINPFVPALNDSFTILTTTGTRTGQFSSTNLPSLPAGRFWSVAYNTTSVVLSVTNVAQGLSLSLNPADFGPQLLNTTSAVMQSVLSNSGPGSATITNIVFGAGNTDFAQALPVVAGDCANLVGVPNGLTASAPGNSCNLRGTFKPTALGLRSTTLTVTATGVSNSPQVLNLQGTGTAPVAGIAPASPFNFGNQPINSTSAAQTFTVSNTGTAALNITAIALGGANANQFILANTGAGSCSALPKAVAAAGNCTFTVAFAPTTLLGKTATVTVTDDNNGVAGSTQVVTVNGTGVTATVILNPTPVNFSNQLVNTTSLVTVVAVTNSGGTAAHLAAANAVQILGTNPGDFVVDGATTTCVNGMTLNAAPGPGNSCNVGVKFAPTVANARTATLTITDDAPIAASQQTATLNGTGVAPVAGIAPASPFNFPNQLINTTSAAQTFTVTNTGTATLNITSIALAGANANQFILANTGAGSCSALPKAVAAAGNCTFTVAFAPTSTLGKTATVTVTDDNNNVVGSTQVVTVNGTGVVPVAGIAPASPFNFPNQLINTTSAAQTFTVANTGTATLNITAIALAGANANQFIFANTGAGSCSALPKAVAAGGNCTFTVAFAPTSTLAKTATVTVTDDNNNVAGSTQVVTVNGTGVAPVAGIAPASPFNFGNQPINTTSAAQTFTVSNTGTATLNITAIALAGANANQFIFANTGAGSCSALPKAVAAAGNCTFTVAFAPTTTLGKTATVTVTDDNNNVAGSTQVITLNGTGVIATVILNPAPVNFSNQLVNTTSLVTVVAVTNSGGTAAHLATPNAVQILGTNPGDFVVDGATTTCLDGMTLNAGNSCNVGVKFAPTVANARTATLTITDDAPIAASQQTATLNGTGVAPVAGIAPASPFNFPNQLINTTSAAQTFTVSNTGTATLNITAIALGGANANQFILANTGAGSCSALPKAVAAAGNCTFTVAFAPTTALGKTATVTVTDDNNNVAGSTQVITVNGTGLTPPTADLSPASLVFGNQLVNTTSSPAKNVSVTNNGGATLNIASIALSGTDAGQYILTAAANGATRACVLGGDSLATGVACNVAVQFKPTSTGAKNNASVTFTDNANATGVPGTQQNVTLTGTGTAPAVTFNPNPVPLGSQRVNTTSVTSNVLVTNSGTGVLNITSIALSGTDAGQYILTSVANGATPACPLGASQLAAGNACNVGVQFKPTSTGLKNNAAVTVTDDVPGSASQSDALSGTGIAPAVTFNPNPVPLGSQRVNTTSVTSNVLVTNSGTDVLNITSIALSGTDAGQYLLSSVANGATPACSLGASALPAASACNVGVQFKPTSTGLKNNAAITVADDVPGSASQSDALSGTGTAPAVTFNPTTKDFAGQNVNTTSAPTNFTLTNSGTDTLHIASVALTGADAGQYILASVANGATLACPLGASQLAASVSCNFAVQFKPTSIGVKSNAAVTVTDDVPGSATQAVTLTGKGTKPTASVSTATVAFGGVTVGDSKAASPAVTLTNTGDGPMTITSITLTGTDAGQYTVAHTCPLSPATLAPNANCTITPTAKPTTSGPKNNASVEVTDDDQNVAGSKQSIALTSMGVDFNLAQATPGPVQVTAGTPANAVLNLTTTPAGTALPADVNYTCAVPASLSGTTCSMNPTKTSAGSTSGNTTLTITSTANVPPAPKRQDPWTPYLPWATATALAGLMAIFFAARQKIVPLRGRMAYLTLALLVITAGGLVGCATAPASTPKGASSITVTATSGGASKTTTVNINVI